MKLPTFHQLWTSKTSNLTFIELLIPSSAEGGRYFAILLHTADGTVWEATV